LKDYSQKEDRYIHLIDGGASDNLGITSLREILKEKTDAKSKKLIIVIDAYKANYGKDPKDPDPRSLLDYYIDSNVIDAYQTLMAELRLGKTDELEQWLEKNNGKLIHLQFDDLEKEHLELHETVTGIKTNLMIKKNEATCLKHAARILVREKMEELRADPQWKDFIQFPPADSYDLPPCKFKVKEKREATLADTNKDEIKENSK
jgi:hypothetical protein